MSKKEEQPGKAWNAWLERLTSTTRAALESAAAEAPALAAAAAVPPSPEYLEFTAQLTEGTRAALAARPEPTAAERAVTKTEARYVLVEAHDGEWPVTRVYKTAEGLARRLGLLHDKDVAVRVIYGITLDITEGPQRYVLLPDGTALSVPLYEGGPCKRIAVDLITGTPVQEDGYLGPPELISSKIAAHFEHDLPSAPASAETDPEPDSDPDEDGDAAGAEA